MKKQKLITIFNDECTQKTLSPYIISQICWENKKGQMFKRCTTATYSCFQNNLIILNSLSIFFLRTTPLTLIYPVGTFPSSQSEKLLSLQGTARKVSGLRISHHKCESSSPMHSWKDRILSLNMSCRSLT